jgi:hypothetical protein
LINVEPSGDSGAIFGTYPEMIVGGGTDDERPPT